METKNKTKEAYLTQTQFDNLSSVENYVPYNIEGEPIATASALGMVKPDGSTITITSAGVISANTTTYTAGSWMDITSGVINWSSSAITRLTDVETAVSGKSSVVPDYSGVHTSGNYITGLTINNTLYTITPKVDGSTMTYNSSNQLVAHTRYTNYGVGTYDLSFIKLTQSEYDSLGTYDSNTFYIIVG